MSFQALLFFPAGNQSYELPARIHVLEGVKKNEFGISRGYISIILIYFEGCRENVENVKLHPSKDGTVSVVIRDAKVPTLFFGEI